MESAFVSCKSCLLIIFVSKIGLEFRSWTFNWLFVFMHIYFPWVVVLIQVWSPNKSTFFLHELICVSLFINWILATKSLHSSIKSIHSTRHRADKLRGSLISITIDLIIFTLYLLTFLHNFVVWFTLFVSIHFTGSSSFSILAFTFILCTKFDSLRILELFHLSTFFDPVVQGLLIISHNLQILSWLCWILLISLRLALYYINQNKYKNVISDTYKTNWDTHWFSPYI